MLLAGCRTTTVGPTPRSLRHDEPHVQNEPFALIKGYAPPGALYDALYAPSTGFIFAVNNRIVNNAADRWNVSVPVKPGKQTVSIQVVRSNRYARGEVVLDVVAFKDYGIRFTTVYGGTRRQHLLRYVDYRDCDWCRCEHPHPCRRRWALKGLGARHHRCIERGAEQHLVKKIATRP